MTSSEPLDREYPKWRTGATRNLQFRGPIYWNAHASSSFDHAHWGYNSVFKQIRRCSVDERKRYENDKCGRKSFWKRSKTAPFSFENGLVWTGPKSTVELQSYIRLDQSNIRLTRIELKHVAFKVIPLKLFYYQTIFETWRNEHLWYEHYKNAIKKWGHRACLRVSRLLKWGILLVAR